MAAFINNRGGAGLEPSMSLASVLDGDGTGALQALRPYTALHQESLLTGLHLDLNSMLGKGAARDPAPIGVLFRSAKGWPVHQESARASEH